MRSIQKWRPLGCTCEVLQLVDGDVVTFITEGQARNILKELREEPGRRIRPDAELVNKEKRCDKHKNLQSPHFYDQLIADSAAAAALLGDDG